MKNQLSEISAVPSKRIYLSIIADYHLHLALCELIDNAIDNWKFNGMDQELEINLDLDYDQQTVKVKDNSGGIKEEDISLIVSPGQSRASSSSEIIGVFGVGSKRAVVALSKQIKIRSRYSNKKTLLIEIDNDWIEDEDNWHLTPYEVDHIEENTTQIELSILREKIEENKHDDLIKHLSATYALFIEAGGLKIIVNEKEIKPITFENWSYPPGYEPRAYTAPITFKDKGEIKVNIIGGLSKSHRTEETNNDEYGVYFYCNDRLITRAYKGMEVGFKPPRVGKPHPSMSLARVIVKITGPVELMPWNSSKSVIDFKHPAYKEIDLHIEKLLFVYTSMSKNWSARGGWPEKVFKYNSGSIINEELPDISRSVRIHVPTVTRKPREPKYIDLLKKKNKELAKKKPWTIGLYEGIIAVEEVSKLKLDQSNRICLILLDSTLEIGFKEYLLNETNNRYSENRIANFNRIDLQTEVKSNSSIKKSAWQIIDAYYYKRCDLVHKRATTQISSGELQNYRKIVEYTLSKLFKIKF
ncbi:Histidine kinase-, DNA gyrase B-, and HSP90-like ATPase [Sinomicrobium oceani]|uniref:Histidine kinase-, DNA gyrase B-, and HSP90-like ATPase n=1 Tax=Sinomicrobium oceani TaxID=1150368 RepID=A0A1K1RWR2_9FLAO|nr:ATP-binding protein [Sinomicrobium oceani]SFW76608.1 Histidine kinase-, DNA gyrase B-, and HSP90-like ATPase [Sinomicrobium oceani]